MAIAYARASVLSRGTSKCSVAAHIGYRAGMCVDGVHDYTPHAEALAEPAYFVGWDGTHGEFAAAVEASEKRCDAQTLREIVWALPDDATEADRSRIVREYAHSLRERYGVAVHVARHRPRVDKQEKGEWTASGRNHHVHISMTLREVDDRGQFVGKKLRAMNAKAWLFSEEERMRSLVNSVAATPARRGPADPSIGAQPHMGRAWHMERRGVRTQRGDQVRAHRAAVAEHERDRAELAQVEAEIAADRAALAQVEAAQPEPEPPRRQSIADRIRKSFGLMTKAEEAAAIERIKEAAQRSAAEIATQQAAEEARQLALEEAERAADAKLAAKLAEIERAARKPMPPPPKPEEVRAKIRRDLDKGPDPEPGQSTGTGRRR